MQKSLTQHPSGAPRQTRNAGVRNDDFQEYQIPHASLVTPLIENKQQ